MLDANDTPASMKRNVNMHFNQLFAPRLAGSIERLSLRSRTDAEIYI